MRTVALSLLLCVSLSAFSEDSALKKTIGCASLEKGKLPDVVFHVSGIRRDDKQYYVAATTKMSEYQLSCQRESNGCFAPKVGQDYRATTDGAWLFVLDPADGCLLGSLRVDSEHEKVTK